MFNRESTETIFYGALLAESVASIYTRLLTMSWSFLHFKLEIILGFRKVHIHIHVPLQGLMLLLSTSSCFANFTIFLLYI